MSLSKYDFFAIENLETNKKINYTTLAEIYKFKNLWKNQKYQIFGIIIEENKIHFEQLKEAV